MPDQEKGRQPHIAHHAQSERGQMMINSANHLRYLASTILMSLIVSLIAVTGADASTIIGSRYQAEGMQESSRYIKVSDEAGDDGKHLRWEYNAPVTARASQALNLESAATEIQIRMKSAGAPLSVNVYLDGTSDAQRIATQIPASTWTNYTVSANIPAGSHTLFFSAATKLYSSQRLYIDYFELYAEDAPPPPPPDADGDGVEDGLDNCPNVANADQADLDSDGIGISCDADRDGDGRPNDTDYAPDDPNVQDPPPPPPSEADADGDGVADSGDNCPDNSNAGQADLDADGAGDACDADIDGDGRPNDSDYDPRDSSVQDPPSTGAVNAVSGLGEVPASPPECDIVGAPGESVSASGNGTLSDPYTGHNAPQAVKDALDPGEVGCLRGGTYDLNGPDNLGANAPGEGELRFNPTEAGTAQNRVTFMSYPGETATIVGNVWLRDGADFITFRDLRVDGTGGRTAADLTNQSRPHPLAAVRVWGDNDEIINNEVFSRNTDLAVTSITDVPDAPVCLNGGGIGAPAQYDLYQGNLVHNCGALADPSQVGGEGTWTGKADEHAMYANNLDDSRVTQNLMYMAAEQAVNIYPDPDRTTWDNNVFVDNGRGLSISDTPDNNVVRNNVIAFPRLSSGTVYTSSDGGGRGTMVHDNCVWNGSGSGIFPSVVFTAINDIARDALFEDRAAHDYTVIDPQCAGVIEVAQH
jgi:parallel beta-helix repeat protein